MWRFVLVLALLLGGEFYYPIHHSSFAEEYKIAQDFKFGYCPLTDRQIIAEGRLLPNYAIVWFELSNGSIMPLAVDKDAINAISEQDFDRIMSWVRAGWMFEINNKQGWTLQRIKDYKDRFFSLTIVKKIEK